jgi:hypothetical protein
MINASNTRSRFRLNPAKSGFCIASPLMDAQTIKCITTLRLVRHPRRDTVPKRAPRRSSMAGRDHRRDLVCQAAAWPPPTADRNGCHEVEEVGWRAPFEARRGCL